MLPEEFEKIILISSKHVTKPDFYNDRRKEGCPPKEYAQQLLASYEDLEQYLNQTDPNHFFVVANKDVESHGRIKGKTYDFECDPDIYAAKDIRLNYEFYKEWGTVSTPFKRCIHFYLENGMYGGRFDIDELLKLKTEIFSYCSNILGSDKPNGSEKTNEVEKNSNQTKEISNPAQVQENESGKIKTENRRNVKKKITIPFIDHLKCEENRKNDLASICNEIFNNNSSEQEFAMMVDSLTVEGLIRISNFDGFCRSWYDYIKKPYPGSGNFTGISKYLSHSKSLLNDIPLRDSHLIKKFKDKLSLVNIIKETGQAN